MDAFNAWAENLTKEIYSEYKNKYSSWKPGLEVFYSPVTARPKLMIIGYQPGGDEGHFKKGKKDRFERLPEKNAYVVDGYPMAKKLQKHLFPDEGMKLLEKSVALNLVFFRAPKVAKWKKGLPKQIRREMENFSFLKVMEVIQVLKPQMILVLGMGTWDRMKSVFGCVEGKNLKKKGKRRMVIKAECFGHDVFATIHPSGARVSNSDWDEIRRLFEQEVSRL